MENKDRKGMKKRKRKENKCFCKEQEYSSIKYVFSEPTELSEYTWFKSLPLPQIDQLRKAKKMQYNNN
jgi:hypothetical protein